MTTRRKMLVWGAPLALVITVALWAGVAVGNNDSTAACPDGQHLTASQVNGDIFSQSKPPPPGAHYSDSVSGSGLDYTLNSDNDSATLKVHGKGTATLQIVCR